VKCKADYGPGIGVRAFRHYPVFNLPGGIPPYFRVHNDAISPFLEESTAFRLESSQFPG
jgi:hypothetical protein